MTDESKANTVNLQGLAKSAAAERPLLPVALEAIKSQSRSFLLTQFNQVLDLLDDRLFELADKANNAKEQQLYFEAMHEIRVGRQAIVARFDEFFTAGFNCASTGVPLSAVERGQAKLKVLESDALEELVAIEGMSKKTEAKYLKEVWLLCTAWQHCLNGPVMAARDLAVGPAAICRALAAAIEGLSLDIKPKLVLLKLFEQKVLKNYDELVAGLLPVLQAHGLPCDLDNAEKKQAEQTADTVNTSGTTGSTEKPVSGNASELANRLFESLEQLLGSAASNSSAGSDELVLSKPSLMVALQDMQNEQYAQLNVRAVVAERGGQQAESKLIHQLIARLEKVNRVAPADASGLTVQRDRDTIQSVGTLFQYILDGEGLSNELKSVIGRLQIPILKMAMLDKNFFSHDDHPARKLLSSLISASIGWTPNGEVEKDPLFNKVEEIVMRVLRDFGVDTQIFVDACAEFQHFSERDRRRTALLTKRAVDAADGRAMAEQARDYIHEYLQLKLSAGEFPPVVTNILRTAWSKVLFISYVQDGKASQQFADDLKTAERLLWSVGIVADSEHRSELINALPGLVESLRDGFNRASLSAFETSQWFEQLERLHLARLSRPVVNNQDEPVQATADLNDLESLDKGLAKGLGEGVGEPSPRPMAKQSYFDAEAGADEVFRPATEPEKPLADVASIEQARGKIAALRVGNWVDYRQNDGKMLRCRLAAVINGLGKYIFVNRSGIKVAELDRDGLVEAIAEQRIFLIEDGRLFDRALESVISNLRNMKDKPL